MPPLSVSNRPVMMAGHAIVPGAPAPLGVDETITFTRVSPVRAAANRFELGITFTHKTFPSGSTTSARNNAKALMAAVDFDYVNMHSHHFGQNGPWTNEDKRDGKTYATRSTWNGWGSWDQRLDHLRDCMGPTSKIIISLLGPGWMKMDGGTYANWESIDNETERRITDAHVTDMNNMARAIKDRHSDVKYFSVFNEQKGNFVNSSGNHSEAGMAAHGLNNIMDYVFEEIWIESLKVALDADGFTDVELMGPYLVLEANGIDDLAAIYAGAGFPQPWGSAPDATHYKSSSDSVTPLSARDETFLEYYLANVNANTRDNWLAVDYKTLGAENLQGNWDVLYEWRWYLMEAFRQQMIALKAITGFVVGTTKIIGMEAYARKVQDLANIPSSQEQAAMSAEFLRVQLEEGVKAELRWAPEQGATDGDRLNLFSPTTDALVDGGGTALPLYYVYKQFADYFRGVNCYSTTSSDDKKVTALASPTMTMLINHLPDPLTVTINGGAAIVLGGYEVRMEVA